MVHVTFHFCKTNKNLLEAHHTLTPPAHPSCSTEGRDQDQRATEPTPTYPTLTQQIQAVCTD